MAAVCPGRHRTKFVDESCELVSNKSRQATSVNVHKSAVVDAVVGANWVCSQAYAGVGFAAFPASPGAGVLPE